MPSLISEQTQFTDTDGLPIVNGSIFIGLQNSDPVATKDSIVIYADRDLTTPLANPQTTDAFGKSLNKIWIPGKYSIQVSKDGVQKYQDLDAGAIPQTGITTLTNVQGTNTITAEGTPAIATLTDQQQYNFTAAAANTGAVTLQIDLTAAKAIKKQHDVDLVSGDFEANQIVSVVYNATDDVYELVSNATGFDWPAPLTNYVRSATYYMSDGSGVVGNSVRNLTSDLSPVGTFKSYGRTGSGTDIEWSFLDTLPVTTRGLIMRAQCILNGDGSTSSSCRLSFADAGVTGSVNNNVISGIETGGGLGITNDIQCIIPCDSNQQFQLCLSGTTGGTPDTIGGTMRTVGYILET